MEHYEILQKVGAGACGAVYLVRCLKTDREFALKKVQLDEQRKTRTKDALLKEVRILSNLKHPHIVGYHDSFFASDADMNFIHIVQDYCDGGTLDEKIAAKRKEGGFFDESLIMQWFIQIAMAVQYMHSRKILHRDLKPQNVFMTKSDGVKLGDFGIAKALDGTLDAAVTCVGTPCYLSPELCQDIPYSSKADIWALGCVLYEICALQPAFDAQNLISLFYKITNAQFRAVPDNFSEDLKSLIGSVLVKEPELRPSASAILNMAMVRNYLDVFIQDREYLLQQKIINLKAAKSSGSNSPTIKSRTNHSCLAGNPGRQSTPVMETKLLQQLPAAWKSVDLDASPKCLDDCNASPEKLAQKSPGSPQYSDDFDDQSSSEEEIVEDLQDIYVKHKQNVSEHDNSKPESNAAGEEDLGNAGYADDFEEDSEAEELDEIIANARVARSVSPTDDFFFDENNQSPNKSIKQQLFGVVSHEKDAEGSLRSKLRLNHTCDGDLMETCYLLDDENK